MFSQREELDYGHLTKARSSQSAIRPGMRAEVMVIDSSKGAGTLAFSESVELDYDHLIKEKSCRFDIKLKWRTGIV